MTLSDDELPAPPERRSPRRAMEARDAAAMLATLAPDVVLRSPVIGVPFRGRDAVAELLGHLMDALEKWECREDLSKNDVHVLVADARIAGRDVELVDVITYDHEGRVREIRVLARPFSGAAAFAAVLGPRLVRGRPRQALVRAATAPLPGAFALGDRAVARLLPARR